MQCAGSGYWDEDLGDVHVLGEAGGGKACGRGCEFPPVCPTSPGLFTSTCQYAGESPFVCALGGNVREDTRLTQSMDDL